MTQAAAVPGERRCSSRRSSSSILPSTLLSSRARAQLSSCSQARHLQRPHAHLTTEPEAAHYHSTCLRTPANVRADYGTRPVQPQESTSVWSVPTTGQTQLKLYKCNPRPRERTHIKGKKWETGRATGHRSRYRMAVAAADGGQEEMGRESVS